MKALKAFAYSHNGIDPIHLAVGDDASDVPESALPGLIAEGYVGDDKKTKALAGAPETGAAQPLESGLTQAQVEALDRDGDRKAGGAPKGGNRKKAAE